MKSYRQNTPYKVAFKLLTPTITQSKGVTTKTFTESSNTFFCSFKTFGGTETTQNGVYSVLNTATVETWYNGNIKADCRIKLIQTGEVYDIISTPENINFEYKCLQFKVRAVEGGA